MKHLAAALLLLVLALGQAQAQNARRIQNRNFAPCPSVAEGQSYVWQAATLRFICAATGVAPTFVGVVTVYDATPTTGVSQLIIRAGAGQASTTLQEWRNNANSAIAFMSSAGYFSASGANLAAGAFGVSLAYLGSGVQLGGSAPVNWGSTVAGTMDVGFIRVAAGVVQVTDGAAGFGRIALDNSTPANAAAACTAKSVWADASFVYVCTASGVIKRVAIATW